MLKTLADIENPLQPPRRLCQPGSLSYATMKTSVCEGVDLPSSGGASDTPCSAVSSAIAFLGGETRPASRVFRRNEAGGGSATFGDDCPT